MAKECAYPKCENCYYDDCIMGEQELQKLLKRRRYHANKPEARKKQNEFRKYLRDNIPTCEGCEYLVELEPAKSTAVRKIRACMKNKRIMGYNIKYCPNWCELRGGTKEFEKYVRCVYGGSKGRKIM